MHYYSIFNLTFRSDFYFPELIAINPSPATFDFEMTKGGGCASVTRKMQKGDSHHFHICIPHVGEFEVCDGTKIIYHFEKTLSPEVKRLYLLGSCVGALLQQRGYLVLHGNAISFNNKDAVIYIGHSGDGKSTMAARHYLQGATVLADDVCAITFKDNQAIIHSSYPQIKLWGDSAELLNIDKTTLSEIRQVGSDIIRKKYALSIKARYLHHSLPISTIYELKKEGGIKNISGAEKIKTLYTHSYRYRFLETMGITTSYIEKLIILAKQIPLVQLNRTLDVSKENHD